VAGVLEAEGHDVKVIDSCAYGYDLETTLEIIELFNPGMVVLDTSTPSIYSDINTGNRIKRILENCFIVLMGTHPTALPEETMNLDHMIDAIAFGEAEFTVKELCNILARSNLKRIQKDETYRIDALANVEGLVYRFGKEVRINRKRKLIEDLDALPFVSKVYKNHLDIRKYFFAASDYPEVQIMTSRGCIAQCSFCVYPQTIHRGKYRMRSPKNIADEFEWIENNISEIKEVGIEDDLFTGSEKRVLEFCKELIARGIGLKWYCDARANLTLETMKWMKKANCVLLIVGYESASEKILKNIHKKIVPEEMIEFSRNARRAGLLVHGCFMAGNNGETRETLHESLRLAMKLMDDTIQFFPLMAYPGTEDYERAKSEGLLTVKSYQDYVTAQGCHNSSVRMSEMEADEIREWCNYARRRYYLRPRYVMYKTLQQVKRPSEIRRTLKALRTFSGFLLGFR